MSTVSIDSLAHGIDSDFKRSLLNGIALFRGVDADSIVDLLPQCGRLDIAAGEVLLSPDRSNHCVYVVLSGQLAVHVGKPDAPKIADLVPGACAGEMSLIEDKDPSAYVVAVQDAHLMVISHGIVWQMVNRSHAFAKNLLVVLSERVRSDNEYIASSLGELRRAEQNAMTDALTGLGNRRWMYTMFGRELERCARDRVPLCLMMVDIDNFKRFNDHYGHIAGDRVLAAVATTLREYLRPTDLVARFGGDEFAILLPATCLADAEQTANRIRDQLIERSPPSLSTPVTISVGITEVHEGDSVDDMVHRADTAMYRAKDAGRDRVATDGSTNG